MIKEDKKIELIFGGAKISSKGQLFQTDCPFIVAYRREK